MNDNNNIKTFLKTHCSTFHKYDYCQYHNYRIKICFFHERDDEDTDDAAERDETDGARGVEPRV